MSDAKILTAPESKDITTITPLYAECASVESIEHQLKQAKNKGRRIARLIEDLEALRDKRLAQIEAGEWPRRSTSEDGVAND